MDMALIMKLEELQSFCSTFNKDLVLSLHSVVASELIDGNSMFTGHQVSVSNKNRSVLLNIDITSGCSFNSMTRSCPVPFAPENGAVNVTGVQPIVTKYSCHVGTLVGPEMRTCLESGWSGEEPFCGSYWY